MSWDPESWSLAVALVVFVMAAAVTVWGGVRISVIGDELADRTGWGEALFGALLLGAAMSLSGIVMTAVAALEDHPGLAYSNAIGGVAAQTAAMVVADFFYTKANLEHAAASLSNLFNGVIVVMLLALAAGLTLGPELMFAEIHVGSFLLIALYLMGLYLVRKTSSDPMWLAKKTKATREDEPEDHDGSSSVAVMLAKFAAIAAVVAAGGWAVAEAVSAIMAHTGINETQAGAILMGITNALPETVVAVSAVRRGALTLAVAGVLGGNAFDVLNLAVGDVAYRRGSIYHAANDEQLMLVLISIFMTATLIAGQIRRQKSGPANIGFESTLALAAYILGIVLISM